MALEGGRSCLWYLWYIDWDGQGGLREGISLIWFDLIDCESFLAI